MCNRVHGDSGELHPLQPQQPVPQIHQVQSNPEVPSVSSTGNPAPPLPASPLVIGPVPTKAKVSKQERKILKQQQKLERKQKRIEAKAALPNAQIELIKKKSELSILKIHQVGLKEELESAKPKQPGKLDKGMARLRNFIHKQFHIGKEVHLQSAPEVRPSHQQVVGTLELNHERRRLEGEIELLSQNVEKLEGQASKGTARKQSVIYWGEKIFRGLSRRGGMGRAGTIEDHTIPSSPILPIRLVEDSINAIRSVKLVVSNIGARSHVRGLESMALGRLHEINQEIKDHAMELQTARLRHGTPQDREQIISMLSQNREIQEEMKVDPELRKALSDKDAEALLGHPLASRILSEDPSVLSHLELQPEFKPLFEQKKILLDHLQPIQEMKAQIELRRELRLIGMNMWKVGVTFVDLVQTSIGIAQIFTLAEPTKIASIAIGALKIVTVIPTFPVDAAIIRSNLKDAAHSLRNLGALSESLHPRELDPKQAIAARIIELGKNKEVLTKTELEFRKDEVKALDKAFKLMKQGKVNELNALIASGKLSKESQYVLKPELAIIDHQIANVDEAQHPQLHRDLLAFREMLVDSDVETAVECYRLTRSSGLDAGLLTALHAVPLPNDVAIFSRKEALAAEVKSLEKQLKNKDVTAEIAALQSAAAALDYNQDLIPELLGQQSADGTPVLSLKSQYAIRPELKVIDELMQELVESGKEQEPDIAILKQARKEVIQTGSASLDTREGLSEAVASKLDGLSPAPVDQGLERAQIRREAIRLQLDSDPRNLEALRELRRLNTQISKLENIINSRTEVSKVLGKGKDLFVDQVAPYMKLRLRMKRITEWIQVASDLLALTSTVASVAALALFFATGWGGLPAFAVVILLLVASTVVRYGGGFLTDQILKGQQKRQQFLKEVEEGKWSKPETWGEKLDQGLRRAGLRGHLMDKREFFPAVYNQMAEELAHWDAIKADGQEEKTMTFMMFNLIQSYLPEKLPPHIDARAYAERLISNEGGSRNTFQQAIGTGMLHHDLSRLTPHKMIKLGRK